MRKGILEAEPGSVERNGHAVAPLTSFGTPIQEIPGIDLKRCCGRKKANGVISPCSTCPWQKAMMNVQQKNQCRKPLH